MKTKILYRSNVPCHIADNGEGNPFREYLTLQTLGDDNYYWIEQAGNGCGTGYALESIDGWSDADVNEQYRLLDLDQLSADATAVREMGLVADAEWLEDWIARANSARCLGDPCHEHNLTIELEHLGSDAGESDLDRLIAVLRAEGYTWARKAEDGERGDVSGITESEWDRVMEVAFNG